VGGEGGGIVFLVGVIGEGAEKNFGARGAGDFLSGVVAAAIDEDNLIGDRLSGVKKPGQIFLFVLSDDAHAEAVHLYARHDARASISWETTEGGK
jgi:hypothetical protein